MGRAATETESLKGKYRFRAVVRKVIINLAWMTEPTEEEEEELEDEARIERAMLKAKSRRRRQTAQTFTLEEKLLFTVPPDVRTDAHVEKCLKVIQRIIHFQKFPEEVQRGLAENCYFLYLKERRTVLREGQEPQAMYFILQGDVLISVEKTDPYSHEPVHEPLAVLSAGDIFGEVALLYNIMRTATVTCTSVVELLGLQKDDFAAVLQKTLEAQWQHFRTEIGRFSYFENWTETQIREMCILGRIRTFHKDETILGDGCGTLEYAYFLLSGTCRLIQTITVEVWEEFGDTVYRLLDDSTLVAVRMLPHATSIDATEKAPSISAEQLAAQDEWKLAAMRMEACIGLPTTSPQWKAARQEVERVLKKEEPFKYKTIVHSEEWDLARQRVIETLGEHTTRGFRRSRSTEQLHKLFGRSASGAPPAPAARRMSTLPGMSGRFLKLPSFVGRPSEFMGIRSLDEDDDRSSHARTRRSSLTGFGPQAEAIRSLAMRASQVGALGSMVQSMRGASSASMGSGAGGGGGASGTREPLQLELVRGRRERKSNKSGTTTLSRRSSSAGSSRSAQSASGVTAFVSESEKHEVIKLRHEFEDPFERTPRPRRMSLTSRGSIRNAWTSAVRLVVECINMCEERRRVTPAEVEDIRTVWRRACRGVERFMKKEQVPVMRPKHRICCHFVQVCFFTPLQVFGIGESMDQRRVTAMGEVECLLMPRYWLDQNNVANVWERVRQYLNRSIPDSRAVFRSWAAERRWLRHRQHVVDDLINRRHIDSGTTPYDVPYSLRLTEISSPHELGYKRRYVIRPNAATAPQRKSSRQPGKVQKMSKPLAR